MSLTSISQPVRGLLATGAFPHSLFETTPTHTPLLEQPVHLAPPSVAPLNRSTAARFAASTLGAIGLVGCHSKDSQKPLSESSVQTATLALGAISVFLGFSAVYLAARRAGLTKRTDVPNFYEDLNKRVTEGNLERSIGRDKDYQRLRDRFHSDDEKITVIVGSKGCGKGHFLFGLAHEVLRQGSIQEFDPAKTLIIEVTLEKLLGFKDFSHFPALDAKMRKLKKTIDVALEKGKKVILIVDTFQRISSTGATEGNANDHVTLLYTQIRQWRKDPRIHLLGATSENDYRRHIEGTDLADDIFPFHLSPIEPDSLKTIVTKKAKLWENSEIRIYPEAIERAIVLGEQYARRKKIANPQAAIDLLEAAKNRALRMAMDSKKQAIVNASLVNEIAGEKPFDLDYKEKIHAIANKSDDATILPDNVVVLKRP